MSKPSPRAEKGFVEVADCNTVLQWDVIYGPKINILCLYQYCE